MKNPVKKLIVSLKLIAFLPIVGLLMSFIDPGKMLNEKELSRKESLTEDVTGPIMDKPVSGGNYVISDKGKGHAFTRTINRKTP